jgi:antitoxin (DNA-binding transcriptional repressor) of toxin-antitoxin stability system
MKTVTIKQLHAKTGSYVRRAALSPVQVTDRGEPVAIIAGMQATRQEVFERIRALRSRVALAKGETARELIDSGRRL